MAFSLKTWKDRITEYPTRRRLTKEDGTNELVTVAREEGQVSQEGDAFSADNMNDLEKRIKAEFDSVNNNLANLDTYLGNVPLSALDDLDKTRNYHALSYTEEGYQAFFMQRGGRPFSIQILFVNGVTCIQWRINFGNVWSTYKWQKLS